MSIDAPAARWYISALQRGKDAAVAPLEDAADTGFRADLPWIAGLVALVAFVHMPILVGGSLFFNDVSELNVPLRHFFGAAWARGTFPMWAPGVYLGFPIFAEGQGGPLYPPNWLFAVLPAWRAYGLLFVGHLAIAAVGTFAFLRRHVRQPAAFVGGGLFALTGYLAVHHMHLNMVQAAALTPVVLATFERMLTSGRPRDLAWMALALGLLALAGHPQTTIQAGASLAGYAALRITGLPGDAWRRATRATVLAVLLGAMLYAIHVSPALELARDSVRAVGLRTAEQMAQHTTAQALAAAVVPSAFGTAGMGTAWLNPGGMPRAMLDLFLGIGAPVLALLAVRSRLRLAWIALVWSAFFLVFTMGPLAVGVPEFYRLPVLDGLRFPDRFNLQIALFVAFAAASGVQAAMDGRVRARDVAAAAMAVALPAGIAIAWTYRRGVGPILGAELARDLAVTAAALATVIAGAWAAGRRPRWAAILLAAGALLPLADFGHRQVPTIAPSYWNTPLTVQAIRAARCPDVTCPLERRLDRVAFRQVPAHYLKAGWLIDRDRYAGTVESLIYNLPLLYDLPAVDGILPLRSREFLDIYQPLVRDRSRSLGVFGARWLVTTVRPTAPGMRRILEGPVSVWEDPNALPRAFAVHAFEVVSDPRARVARVVEGSGLRDTVVLNAPPEAFVPTAPPVNTGSTVRIAEYAENAVRLETSMAADGFVVLLDRDYPGWQARIDGEPAPILRANHLFRAVRVSAGEHRVTFAFRPRSLALGALGSGLALAGILGLFALDRIRGRRRAPDVPFPESGPPHAPRGWRRALPFLLTTGWLVFSALALWARWKASFVPFTG